MRRSILAAGLAAGMFLATVVPVQAEGMGAGGNKTGAAGENQAARGEMGEKLAYMMVAAVSAPWAKSDAQVQQLVTKILADRQTVVQDEQANLAAFKNLLEAAQSGNENAIATAKAALEPAMQKTESDRKQTRQDVEALIQRMQQLRPAGAGQKDHGAAHTHTAK